jgi:hypothetical protein
MKTEAPAVEKILKWSVCLGPFGYILAAAYITLSRFTYPFDLEWMEGGSLQHLLRLLEGKPLYVAPSLEFTPYIYPPFYYYVALGVSRLTGLTWFEPLRLTSLLASLGCGILIGLIVRKQTGSPYWSLLAAGLFAATFRAGGAWFDIARVDMLFLCLTLAALYTLVASPRPGAEIFAGLLFALAFYTKQTALGVCLPLLALVFWMRGWRAGLRLGLPFLLIAALTFGVENQISGGWYAYYLFHLPNLHQVVQPLAGQLLVQIINIFTPLVIAAPVGLVYALTGMRPVWKSDAGLSLCAALCLTGLSVAAGLNQGSYDNAYLPAFAGFAILFGLGGSWLEKELSAVSKRKIRPFLYLAGCLQFILLAYNIPAQIPTAADRRAGEELVARLRETPGEVLVPYHNTLAILAGKPVYTHHIALLELQGAFGSEQDTAWSRIENELARDLDQGKFSLILLDGKHSAWELVYEKYRSAPLPYADPEAFYPVTGARTRPSILWSPPPGQ